MHVLMLSTDDRIFEADSEARRRMAAYGTALDSLHILVFTRRPRSAGAIAANVHAYPTPAAFSPTAFLEAYRQGARILAMVGRDAVITSQEAFTNIIAFLLKFRFGCPVQAEIHTDCFAPAFRRESFKNRLRYHLYRWSVRRADGIRAVSERIRRSVIVHVPAAASRITVLPVFVDIRRYANAAPAFALRERFPGASPLVLWVGRLTHEKNPALAVDVMAGVVRKFPRALLLMLGDGPERKNLESGIMNRGLAANVRLIGWQHVTASYYRGADALLATSRYEGYGRMFVEAAAAGLAIVSTDVGVIGEMFKDGDGAVVFRNPSDGARAIARIARDPAFAGGIRKRARVAVAGLPDFPDYLRRYREALELCARG